jgi:hypothetical protein
MTKLNSITHNVHEQCGDKVQRVQADVNRDIYDYFFHHVIAYTHNSRQSIINFFFQRFYEECISRGIQPIWDETNGDKLVEILNQINFNGNQQSEPKRRTNKRKPVSA